MRAAAARHRGHLKEVLLCCAVPALRPDRGRRTEMITEFKGTFRDCFEGEKEYHITENVRENGIFEYAVFCPFSSRTTTVQSRVKLDKVACNGCLRAYQIYRPQAVESAADRSAVMTTVAAS
jgi:hypothetical protein